MLAERSGKLSKNQSPIKKFEQESLTTPLKICPAGECCRSMSWPLFDIWLCLEHKDISYYRIQINSIILKTNMLLYILSIDYLLYKLLN